MKNTPVYYLTFFILLCTANPFTHAQEQKREAETSIKKSEMPAAALNILNEFWNDEKKADFYREFDGKTVSYEAKFMHNDHLISIEFSEEGLLEDIEQLIEFHEIPENTGTAIRSYLNDQYIKFKITRVQRQFSGSDSLVQNFLAEDFKPITIRYELEVEAQNKKELGDFEFLFNRNGQFIQKREIVRRSLDNIW